MRKTLSQSWFLALVLVTASSCTTAPTGTEPERARSDARVMVLGVDGGTWTVLEPMMAAGELPNFKRLYDGGIHGILTSRAPIISPVVWTTMFTGKPHAEHGVRDWKTSQTIHRKVKALWNMTHDREYESFVFNVPGSWPPEEITGAMLSGFPLPGSTVAGNTGLVYTMKELRTRRVSGLYRLNMKKILAVAQGLQVEVWSDWFDVVIQPHHKDWEGIMRIKRLTPDRFYLSPLYRVDGGLAVSYPAELRDQVSEQVGTAYIPEGPGWSRHDEPDTPAYLYDHLLQVFNAQSEAARLFAPKPWDLFIFVMTLVDRVSHPYWAYSDPDHYDEGLDREKAALYADAVRNSYIETDKRIGELMDATEGEFYVVVASDHGFHSSRNKSMYIGTHHFDGIYMVWGPGLEGTAGERTHIEDIGPTVLYLMGMPVARDMEGKVVPEVRKLIGRDAEIIDTYEDVERESTDMPVDDETWEQLRGLGYVDGAPPRKAAEEKARTAADKVADEKAGEE